MRVLSSGNGPLTEGGAIERDVVGVQDVTTSLSLQIRERVRKHSTVEHPVKQHAVTS